MTKKFTFLVLGILAAFLSLQAQPTAEIQKLLAGDGAANDSYGSSVSISGDYAIVGTHYHNARVGAAYIYFNNAGTWELKTKLTAADGIAGDEFGYSVSISGDYAVVGSILDDDKGNNSGSAYVFYKDQGGADTWGQQAKLTAADGMATDFFGYSVCISDDYVIVGAVNDDDKGSDSGSAYIFNKDEGGTDSWGQKAKLIPSNGAIGHKFGYSVSISGNYAVVGAENVNSAYVFYKNEGGTDTWGQNKILTANTAYFGNSVSISGDYLIVGAYGDFYNSGFAYLYFNNAGTWEIKGTLFAPDRNPNDYFGNSVCISGDYAIVGAWGNDDDGSSSGSAYVFYRNEEGTDTWKQIKKITAADGAASDYFGRSVSISGHGAIIGAIGNDDKGSNSGSAYIFGSPPAPTVTTQPISQTGICPRSNVSFTVAGTHIAKYQWQVDEGSGFVNITNGGVYSNVKTATVNIAGVKFDMNSYQYRCIVENVTDNATSDAATCTVLLDTSDPEIPILADIKGECYATATAPTTTDACAGTITGTTTNPLSYYTQGTYIIVWNFNDGNGNNINVNQNVIIEDVTPPIMPTLADIIDACSATAKVPSTYDNCKGYISGTTTDPLSYNTQGTHVITWNFDDGNGNSINVNQNVIIDDVTAPVEYVSTTFTSVDIPTPTVDENTITVDLMVSGLATALTSGDLQSVCIDIDHPETRILAIKLISPEGTIFDLSLYNGRYRPEKKALESSSLKSSSTGYSGTCFDMNAVTSVVNGNKPFTGNFIPQGAGGFDVFNDENPNGTWKLSVYDSSYPFEGIPDGNVTFFAMKFNSPKGLDDVYAECSTTVTPPTINDNCAGIITGTTTDPLTYSTLGTHVITWTFDDGNGNSSELNQNVIITSDATAPVADAASLADINDECSVDAPTAPTASDHCAGLITGVADVTFPITTQGTTVVTWTFDDGNGNSSTQKQNVIITGDVTAPAADAASLADINGECSVDVPTAPTATDHCTGSITGVADVIFPVTAQGTTVVTWTFDDGNGNSSTQKQNVIITGDVTAPAADAASLADLNNECSVDAPTAPTATDNCAGSITGVADVSFPVTAQGTTLVTWTFDDGNGNSSTQKQNVVINDVTAPLADAASLADLNGECSADAPTAPTATDNCAGSITGVADVSFPVTAQGTTVVTWTFNDGNGNTSIQKQNIVITDVTAPVADVTNLPTVNEQCSVLLTAPTATDNCEGRITATTTSVFPLTASETVTWKFKDSKGNESQQTQEVVIEAIDVSVTQDAAELTANGNGVYQWIDCDSGLNIDGETSQSFTATRLGNYAVKVSIGSCSETSDCINVTFTEISSKGLYANSTIWPNPTKGKLFISDVLVGKEYAIYSLAGSLVMQGAATEAMMDLSELKPGMYMLSINGLMFKIVKK